MKRPRPPRRLLLVLVSALLLLSGGACVSYVNAGTLRSTVDSGGASRVAATFRLSHGRLALRGGASSLMSGSFTTDDRNDPTVHYTVHGKQGDLTVTQSTTQSSFGMIPVDNSWTVAMNDQIPINLAVDNDGANVNLDLDTLTMTRLSLTTNVGPADIDLNGVQRALTLVNLTSTSGTLTLTMHGNYAQPRVLEAHSVSGGIRLDLGSDSAAGLTGSVRSDTGPIWIALPRDIGFDVTTTTGGRVEAQGLTQTSQGTYTNPAHAAANPPLRLDIESTSGTITLQLAK